MTIDEAIADLQQAKRDGVKHIVLAYWTAEWFDQKDDDQFAADAAIIEDEFDWSYTHESMETFLEIYREEGEGE